ncbi:NUDIX hydrolase [Myxococcota bacterium]|nr:NUDIX hydrolase [Myxococcota bacterium]
MTLSLMSREKVIQALAVYAERHPEEQEMVARVRELVTTRDDCFERTCLPGHITASSWIFSSDLDRFLLTHHRKLGRWLQLGGHADGDSNPLSVALREAREESGMAEFDLLESVDTVAEGPSALSVPADVDIHRIPARPGEPEHAHYDLRFILVAAEGQPLVMSSESSDLAWFRLDQLETVGADESLLRLGRKAIALQAEPPRLVTRTPLGKIGN